MKKAEVEGSLQVPFLAAHAKRVLLSLHEKRGEPLTACLCPPTFPFCLRALRSKAGLLLAFAGLAAGFAPGRGPVNLGRHVSWWFLSCFGMVARGASKLLRSARTSLTS